MVTQIIHERGWLGKQPPRDDDKRRAGLHGRIDILDRYIEIKRRLVADHIVRTDAEQRCERRDKVQHRAVADHHTLRRSGRAGCKQAVQRVLVGHACPDVFQRSRVRRRLQQVFYLQHLSCGHQLPGERPVYPICQNAGRTQHFQHLPQPRLRQVGVQRHIKASCLHSAEECAECVPPFFHQHRDGGPRPGPHSKRRTYALAAMQQFAPAAAAVFCSHSHLVRLRGSRHLQKFQNIFHIDLLSVFLISFTGNRTAARRKAGAVRFPGEDKGEKLYRNGQRISF